jgi:sulfate permease, SulP family
MSLQGLPFIGKLKGYPFSSCRQDLGSALVVALLAIPQAIAYSLLAGLPAASGIFCAIFGTIFTASWSSSRYLISGPSTGVSILLQATIADILATYFPLLDPMQRPEMALHILLQLVVLIGLMQISFAFLNIGKLLQFVSKAVMLGYFSGVAIAIITSQIGNFLGIAGTGSGGPVFQQLLQLSTRILEINPASVATGISGIFLLFFIRKRFPRLPDAILMLSLVALLGFLWNTVSIGPKVATLQTVGTFSLLPEFSFPVIDLKLMNKILPQALALALLGVLEVFSVSRALSSKSGERVSANQDVFAIGISNLLLSLFSFAMPASGSMSRSLLNYHARAKTFLSALYSGAFVFLLLFALFPLISHIPMAALAALLLLSSRYLVEKEQVKLCFKATKEDALVFLLTLISCIIFTLDVAFFVGIVISIITYLKKAASPHFVEFAFNEAGRLSVINPSDKKHRKVRIIGIGGELFFASVDVLQNALHAIAEDPYVKVIVLRLQGVYHLDASMCLAIMRLHGYLKQTERHLVISGLTQEVWRVLNRSSLAEKIGQENLFLSDEGQPQLSTWKACLRAQELIPKK